MGALALAVIVAAASPPPAAVVLRGTFRALAIDGPRVSRSVPELVSRTGVYRLDLAGPVTGVVPGQTVTVRGTLTGDTLRVTRISPAGTTPATTAPTGPMSVLVMFASWNGPDSVTQAQAADVIGTQDTEFYADSSFGQFKGFVPTETPWLTIPDPGTCNFSGIIDSAEQAAIAAGYTPSAYDREVVYTPDTNMYCSGLAGMADEPGRHVLILHGDMLPGVTDHELGHTFGLDHANALICTGAGGAPVSLGATCTTRAYGDLFDTMGSTWQVTPHGQAGGLFNAMETSIIGWMAPPRIRAVSTGQTVTLVPYEDQGSGLHAISLKGDKGPATFYLEYRRPIGWDAFGYPLGLIVRRNYGTGTDLLDMTPGSMAGMTDAPLPVGVTWTGPFAGDPSITLLAAGATGATVQIAYGVAAPGAPGYHIAGPFTTLAAVAKPPVPASVDFTASSASGLCSYQLQRSLNGAAFTPVTLSGPLVKVFKTSVTGGTSYRFRVRARTCAGGLSVWAYNSPFTVSLRQDSGATYTGVWSSAPLTGAWGGSVHTTTAAGATATLHVSARNIAVVGTRGPGYGSFEVIVDGALQGTVSANASAVHPRQVLTRLEWPQAASHTIKLVAVGSAGHPRIDLDGFLLYR